MIYILGCQVPTTTPSSRTKRTGNNKEAAAGSGSADEVSVVPASAAKRPRRTTARDSTVQGNID